MDANINLSDRFFIVILAFTFQRHSTTIYVIVTAAMEPADAMFGVVRSEIEFSLRILPWAEQPQAR